MFRGLSQFIHRKRAKRKFRVKGTDAAIYNRPGRNSPRGVTAVDLWQSRFRFKETPAAKAAGSRAAPKENGANAAPKINHGSGEEK